MGIYSNFKQDHSTAIILLFLNFMSLYFFLTLIRILFISEKYLISHKVNLIINFKKCSVLNYIIILLYYSYNFVLKSHFNLIQFIK